MGRRKRIYYDPQNRTSYRDSVITQTITGYALNLLQKVDLRENILTAALDSIAPAARIDFINELYCNEKDCEDRNENRGILYDALEDTENPKSLASTIIHHIYRKQSTFNKYDVRRILAPYLEKENTGPSSRPGDFNRRLEELAQIFRLGTPEIELLKLLYFAFALSNSSLNNVFDNLHFSEFVNLASVATGLTVVEIRKSLRKNGLLVSSGIIDSIDHTGRSFISIDDSIAEYLTGLSDSSIVEKYIRPDRGSRLKLSDFSIPAEDSSIIGDLLKSGHPCNILLYGIPGTGKTEFARSIAVESNDRVYSVRYGDSGLTGGYDSDSRLLALRVAINTVSDNGGILIVDEADFLLNTIFRFSGNGMLEKGWLNDLLDNSKARIIWITNRIGEMEESTLRRFSYSLCFKKFNKDQRISVWNNLLKRNPLKKNISPELIAELSQKYEVNAGAIASSVAALKQISVNRDLNPGEIKPLLENLLTKHSVLINGDIKKKNRLVELTDKYDLRFLNTDADITSVVSSAKRFNELNKQNSIMNSMNLLLWGESGAGKTEFAKYLASQTGMGLIIKRASDLMDMWVGSTEKYICQAFREAEEKRSILFIDEADTFFGARENARASWEVSQTNEFFVQMENFNGILVCCTNLLEIFDTAAMRRFNWKIRFSPVLSAMRVPLYEKYFAQGASPLTQKQKRRISSIEMLTPGHVKAVSQRRFFAEDEIPDHDSIIDEVEREASYMKIRSPKKAGF